MRVTRGFSKITAGVPNGAGILSASIILAIMILPFIAATMRELLLTIPAQVRESAYGLGSTTFEVVRKVSIPYVRTGAIGAVMLGLGRALGETMAVAMVLSSAGVVTFEVLTSTNPSTIAANIALSFPEAYGLNVNVLIATGLMLFAITLVVNSIARWVVNRRKEFS